MITKIVKTLLFAGVVLFVGQIKISGQPLAEHFVTRVGASTRWAAGELSRNKMFSGFELPSFMQKWLGEKKSLIQASTAEVEEEFTDVDNEKLLHLLN